jgi:uncharacterized C2H2 Zn-finger protein
MTRLKPYTTNQESWHTILQKRLQIPMNQREYSWGVTEIQRFLDDIIKIFEEDKYVEKMGSIINLNYNGNNDIYDGQQRILTTILILNTLGCLSDRLKSKINILLTVDTDLDTLTEQQQNIKDKSNVSIIPKIYCINPYDMEALVDIFNDKIKSFVEYVDEINSLDEEEHYICNKCNKSISRRTDFIRHIEKKHGYIKPKTTSKLYVAFIEIFNNLTIRSYNEDRIIELYKFILNDIDVQFYNCTDPEYVSRIFDWENNRGKSVETLDLIKNPILVQIQDDKKVEVYEKWEELKHKDNKIYKKNYGQKIFDVAIQLYNGKINRTINQENLFKSIIDNENTYKELNIFFNIVEDIFVIMDKISDDKYGRLLNNTLRICLNWEAYMWCLLPIFYTIKSIDKNLINLMTKWYFRNLQFKNQSFTKFCYSNEFIKITNEVLENKGIDYYKDIEKCLVKNKDNSVTVANYSQTLTDMNFKSTNATHLLLFLETCLNTDIHIVPLDYTLEHIFCQKDKNKLKDQSLMNNIGNLTLIEGKNSDNGHKGNSSLGSKMYDKKITSYKQSSCKLTRDIPETYNNFNEGIIIDRCSKITSLLNKYTHY